jgi:CheY-like chemotaxis protein
MTIKNILIIDDDAADTELYSNWLSRPFDAFSTHILTATSVDEGIEKLRQNEIHCIFLDYRMGTTNGLDFLEAIKPLQHNPPILFLTAFPEASVKSQSLLNGVQFFMDKSNTSERSIRGHVKDVIEFEKTELLETNQTIQQLLAQMEESAGEEV